MTSSGRFRVSSTYEARPQFDKHIVDEGFVANPEITRDPLIEADDVVVAEGSCERSGRTARS